MSKLKIGLGGLAGIGALYSLFGMNKKKSIPMSRLNSSMIRSAGYDKNSNKLSVRFNDGHVYEFNDVPESVYNELKTSDSAGTYFNNTVRGKYEHEKVSSMSNKGPFDRIEPPRTAKSLSDVLVDLRKLDTPEKWKAYVAGKHYAKDQKTETHHVK